ncbi:nucleotidyltransferase domain-containing protein [Pseudomonas serbica]|uniref:nucleotidyltransferase domain-containing protein n=1 Tax=Pseudomonas serbica TaxID=2965074 RepID=UPI00237B78A5|nr:nucleotidyltransferase domain-containing protein [Pseudomonas serbica]
MITAIDAEKQINELIAKQDVSATINEFKSRIEVEIELEKVVLFGSRARGDNDLDSDIDISHCAKSSRHVCRKKTVCKKAIESYFRYRAKNWLGY